MKHQRFLVFLSVFAILFCLTGSLVFPQRLTGILRGTVKDEQGELLPGVTVEIESPALIGGIKSTVTTASGTFLFASLITRKVRRRSSHSRDFRESRERISLFPWTKQRPLIYFKAGRD